MTGRARHPRRVAVVSMPFAGHVGPMSAVAGELARRGHEVVAHTGAKYRSRFEAAGATWLPWTAAPDFDDTDLAATFPAVGTHKGLRGGRLNVEHVLFGTAAGQAADLRAAAADRPFDALVTDQTAFGGALAGLVLHIPWATVAVTPLSLLSTDLPPAGTPGRGRLGRARDAALRRLAAVAYRRVTDPMVNRIRASVGLGPAEPGRLFDTLYSPHLVLAQGVAGLDYPRSDLPPYVHHIGRLAPHGPAGAGPDLPGWWPDVVAARRAGRPVVHVTQGTLDTDPDDLLKPALTGLADQDVLVVCTTGNAPVSVLGPLPANARAATFIPHDQLLPLVDVMVTNGGWGGVLGGIEAGIPLVVAGGSLDKPEVARRVAWSGAGLNLRTGRPRPARVGAAVREVLDRPAFRERARDLSGLMTAAGGTATAGRLLADLLARR